MARWGSESDRQREKETITNLKTKRGRQTDNYSQRDTKRKFSSVQFSRYISME